MELTSTSVIDFKKVDDILSSYDYKKENLIGILQRVQESFRFVPIDVMTYIGTKIVGLSPATVYGVATFYAQFSLEPKGKYEIKLCDGTACHVRGSMPVLTAIKSKLKLGENDFTTKNGMFSVETVSCLGACGLAPVVVINEKVYPQMTADAIKIVVETIVNEENEG